MTRARNKRKKKHILAEKHAINDWGRMPKHARKFYLDRKNNRHKKIENNL